MSVAKWILGGLGFVLGGPIGALVGVLIGSLFSSDKPVVSDNSQGQQSSFSERRRKGVNTIQGDVHVALLVLIACVMKADNHIRRSELDLVKKFLLQNYGEDSSKKMLLLLKDLLEKDIDIAAVCDQIRNNVNYSTRLEIVHFLLDIANADGEFAESEQTVIERIAHHIGLFEADYLSILAPYQKVKNPNWAYDALEITPQASDEEIKKAYRRMAMKYHPDKVASAGEDIKQKATEKFRSIKEAYETLCTARGIK